VISYFRYSSTNIPFKKLITSRPQTANFIAFILFLMIAFALVTINILSILRDPAPPIFNYAIVTVLTPIALFISWKTIFRYKVIRMGNAQIDVRYPQFRIRRSYPLKEISYWKETIIKTGKKSTYKELEIKFSDNRKITMAFREYSEYEKMMAYLGQKASRLKKED
jgi:magnesium-transporting ATPase (P-type)